MLNSMIVAITPRCGELDSDESGTGESEMDVSPEILEIP